MMVTFDQVTRGYPRAVETASSTEVAPDWRGYVATRGDESEEIWVAQTDATYATQAEAREAADRLMLAMWEVLN